MNEIVDSAKGSGGRGKGYSTMKQTWSEVVWAEALRARIHRPGPFAGLVQIRFLWVERDQRRDKDNVAAAKKFILDGLVSANVISGDGWGGVAGFTDEFAVDAARPGVHVTITLVE
jgi:hypothetical protein